METDQSWKYTTNRNKSKLKKRKCGECGCEGKKDQKQTLVRKVINTTESRRTRQANEREKRGKSNRHEESVTEKIK